MKVTSRWRRLYLTWFSKPVVERPLYRLIARRRPKHFLFVGLGDGRLALRMLQMARGHAAHDALRLSAIDLFKASPASRRSVSLKQAHQSLKPLAARVHLMPGDPHSALARAANSLADVDFVLVAADQSGDALERAWFYVPRMLATTAIVLQAVADTAGETTGFAEIERSSLQARAQAAQRKRAA